MDENKVNENYEYLLNNLPEEVSDELRNRYQKDSVGFQRFLSDNCPSDDPKYWSNYSCNKCFGKGTLGKKYTFMPGEPAKSGIFDGKKGYTNVAATFDVKCKCYNKNYSSWVKEMRIKFNNRGVEDNA